MDINQTIEANMGLVYKKLYDFGLRNDPEAVSRATEALWNAVSTWREDRAVKLSTYASVCIYNALGCYIRHIKRKGQLQVVSYDEEVVEGHTYEELLGDSPSAEEVYLTNELNCTIHAAIDKVASTFSSEAMQQLVRFWFANNCIPKQRELADRFGVSQSYASRVLSMAKHRLKKELEEYVCEK